MNHWLKPSLQHNTVNIWGGRVHWEYTALGRQSVQKKNVTWFDQAESWFQLVWPIWDAKFWGHVRSIKCLSWHSEVNSGAEAFEDIVNHLREPNGVNAVCFWIIGADECIWEGRRIACWGVSMHEQVSQIDSMWIGMVASPDKRLQYSCRRATSAPCDVIFWMILT